MNNRKKNPYSIYLIMCSLIFVSCGQRDNNYLTSKPKEAEIVGCYILSDQTIIKGGLSALQGRKCRLELRIDGSFSVVNYPNWRVILPDVAHYESFISTTGKWRIDNVGGSGTISYWGIRFSENLINPSTFIGEIPPYGLVTVLGDPDTNKTLIFRKEKCE